MGSPFVDLWEAIADAVPGRCAQITGAARFTWRDLDRRADGVADALVRNGLGRQDKVAQYLHNGPEYLESLLACYKAALVPVNTNYRYGGAELSELWDDADVAAVVLHGSFVPTVESIVREMTGVKLWLWVDDGTHACPEWALPYESVARSDPGRFLPRWDRTPEDLYLLYTGGTTGRPKGVMWTQGDLFSLLQAGSGLVPTPGVPMNELVSSIIDMPIRVHLAASPLMHGAGALRAFGALDQAGTVVTLQGRRFDPIELLDTIERERVTTLSIVGDAFARPILDVLDAEPGRWDLSTLESIASSGVMWSEETKRGLLRHHPGLVLLDGLSSSEAIGIGSSRSSSVDGVSRTGQFVATARVRLLGQNGEWLPAGSTEAGLVALAGPNPLGYYKDPMKTAETFRVIDGERFAIPGDWAVLNEDGSLRLLGRGSSCVNTGGEKVHVEEVEEALKRLRRVRDAAVVGLPDPVLGEAVVAVLEVESAFEVDVEAIRADLRSELAPYKLPREVVAVQSLGRGPNGKLDYARIRADAAALLRPTEE